MSFGKPSRAQRRSKWWRIVDWLEGPPVSAGKMYAGGLEHGALIFEDGERERRENEVADGVLVLSVCEAAFFVDGSADEQDVTGDMTALERHELAEAEAREHGEAVEIYVDAYKKFENRCVEV